MCAQSTANCPMGDACPCPKKDCDNYGKCCQCIKAHRASGTPAYCMAKLVEKN